MIPPVCTKPPPTPQGGYTIRMAPSATGSLNIPFLLTLSEVALHFLLLTAYPRRRPRNAGRFVFSASVCVRIPQTP
nr:MAG TPA: hypothetical protein [Caudoviricetes sp.]